MNWDIYKQIGLRDFSWCHFIIWLFRDANSLFTEIDSLQDDLRLNTGETPPREEDMLTVFAPVDDRTYGIQAASAEILESERSRERVIRIIILKFLTIMCLLGCSALASYTLWVTCSCSSADIYFPLSSPVGHIYAHDSRPHRRLSNEQRNCSAHNHGGCSSGALLPHWRELVAHMRTTILCFCVTSKLNLVWYIHVCKNSFTYHLYSLVGGCSYLSRRCDWDIRWSKWSSRQNPDGRYLRTKRNHSQNWSSTGFSHTAIMGRNIGKQRLRVRRHPYG